VRRDRDGRGEDLTGERLVARHAAARLPSAVAVPAYLTRAYWWAYVHPLAVRVFERQWLVNLILWGNFARLRDAALDALGARLPGRTLQVACVYGDLTPRLAARVAAEGRLDVVDVLPIQLENLARKLPARAGVGLLHANSAALPIASCTYDRALLFFLLHEQPEHVRRATLAEALRVVRPGGRVVIVDYHRPRRAHPLRGPMRGVLHALEPFALDLWRHDIREWLPGAAKSAHVDKRTAFGDLYQIVTITAA
jgi:ubiquinone/menaquinone biosynthesis C-methylase UbiE